MKRHWAFSLAALAALAALPSTASAGGGLALSPARVEATVRAGDQLPLLTARNGTNRALTVEAFVLTAGQELSGLAAWTVSSSARRSGRKLATVTPSRFTLRRGEQRKLRVTIKGRKPLRGLGSYGVVVLSAAERRASSRGAGVVASRVRLSANLLLRYRGHGGPAGEVEEATVTQGPNRSLLLAGRVHNRGRLHGRASGTARVRDSRGKVVWKGRLAAGAVLPFARRDIVARANRVLDAGDYSLRTTVRFAGRTTSATTRFRLVAPGTLPTPPPAPAKTSPAASAHVPTASWWDRLRDWAATHVEVLLGTLVALLIAVLGGALVFVVRSLRASQKV